MDMENTENVEQMEQASTPEAAQIPDKRREASAPQAPKRRRQPAAQPSVPAFLAQLGQDVRWYFDIRLWSPVLLVLLVLCACTGSKLGASGTAKEYEATIQKMEAEWKEERELLVTLSKESDGDGSASDEAASIDPEAEALAILADVVGAGRSYNVKAAIMWVAINRSENPIEGHGKSLLEEINMPLQWQGYDPEKTYTYSQETLKIAEDVIKLRDSGGLRPLDSDMMWLVLNDNGSITIRNKFMGNNVVEKTIK